MWNHSVHFIFLVVSCQAEARKKKYWTKASNVVLLGCGAVRGAEELRKTWADPKVRAHKYEGIKRLTGGGPQPPVTPEYEAVLAAMAPQSRHGVVGEEMEAGFSPQSSQSQFTKEDENNTGQLVDILAELAGIIPLHHTAAVTAPVPSPLPTHIPKVYIKA